MFKNMKLACSVSIGNRLLPALAINCNRKHVQSTLALCKLPNTEKFCILLFSGNNKNSVKYDVKGNINQVLTRFLHEGKATIQFKEPQHDLYIQADNIQLRSFLHLLKLVLQDKTEEKNVKILNAAVTPTKVRHSVPRKLTITKRSEFPLRGLPRTLEVLHMNDIERYSVGREVWQLTKLRVLDLSHNCIVYLPNELQNMPCLMELNVSYNDLGKALPRQWNWIGGYLTRNLKLLNLAYNGLQVLPTRIGNLHGLITLNIDNNELKTLPPRIGKLQHLKILTASNNLLSFLPGTMITLRLHSLDLSNNPFDANYLIDFHSNFAKTVCTLKELSARKILFMGIAYSSDILPLTVCNYLDLANYCVCGCGKSCFDVYLKHHISLNLHSIAQNVCTSGLQSVPIECCFCSMECYGSKIGSCRNRII